MRVGIYARVSTTDQTADNQIRELRAWAERCGHEVSNVFRDDGISGVKGREKRPAFDALLKAATRRQIDLIAVWSTDRLARSMTHLIEVLQTLHATKVQLYVHTQALDTTTPSGRALFQMMGVFSELEREMLIARIKSGIARARSQGVALGRAPTAMRKATQVRELSAAGLGPSAIARQLGIGRTSVHRILSAPSE